MFSLTSISCHSGSHHLHFVALQVYTRADMHCLYNAIKVKKKVGKGFRFKTEVLHLYIYSIPNICVLWHIGSSNHVETLLARSNLVKFLLLFNNYSQYRFHSSSMWAFILYEKQSENIINLILSPLLTTLVRSQKNMNGRVHCSYLRCWKGYFLCRLMLIILSKVCNMNILLNTPAVIFPWLCQG